MIGPCMLSPDVSSIGPDTNVGRRYVRCDGEPPIGTGGAKVVRHSGETNSVRPGKWARGQPHIAVSFVSTPHLRRRYFALALLHFRWVRLI